VLCAASVFSLLKKDNVSLCSKCYTYVTPSANLLGIMASVKFIFRKDKISNDGTSPIHLQIIHKRSRRVIATGISAFIYNWDDRNGQLINFPKSEKHVVTKKNFLLKKLSMQAEEVIIDFETSGDSYTVDDVIAKLKGVESTSFINFTEKTIKELLDQKKDGNARVYNSHLNIVKKFVKNKEFNFDQITYKWLKSFETYLIGRNNSINSISFQMRTLRAIYNRAIKEKLAKKDSYPFDDYKIQSVKTQKRALKKEDIILIRDLDLVDKIAVERARDLFMFSFYCMGMSFIDIAYLKAEDIRDGRLYYARKKTSQQYNCELLPPALEIIKKYSDLENPREYVFPIIDPNHPNPHKSYLSQMQKTNHKLRDLAKLIELNISLTSYVARHSWATIAKRSGIPTAVISEGLGHTTENTT